MGNYMPGIFPWELYAGNKMRFLKKKRILFICKKIKFSKERKVRGKMQDKFWIDNYRRSNKSKATLEY